MDYDNQVPNCIDAITGQQSFVEMTPEEIAEDTQRALSGWTLESTELEAPTTPE